MKIVVLFLFATFLSNCYAQYSFQIKGTTPDLFNNHKMYLTVKDSYSNNRYEIEDSVIIKENHFFFSGMLSKPSEKAVLSTKDIRGFFYFAIDTGTNEISVQPLKPKTPLYKNKLSNSKVLRSASNRIVREIDSLINYYYLAKGEPAAFNKNVIELSRKSKRELRNKQLEIIESNPENYYSLIHLYAMFKTAEPISTTEAMETYDRLSNTLKNSELGSELYKSIQTKKTVEIGSMVKPFSANTNNGIFFTNSSLEGKPYLLAFGATWCQPCKENLPLLKQLYSRYKPKGLEVVYVNLDEHTEKWKSQVTTGKFNWINVSENVKWNESNIVKLFNITPIPFYLLIDKTGKIVYNNFQIKDDGTKELEKYIIATL